MSGSHISEELIDRYAMGILEEDAKARVEEHLLDCPHCQQRLLDADEFLSVFREAATQPGVRPAPAWRRLRYFGKVSWAAAAAGAVLLAFLIVPKHTNSSFGTVELQSLRGPEAAMRISSGQPGLLKFDVIPQSGVGNYQIQVVDTAGDEVLAIGAFTSDGRLAARIGKLARGSYWVRVYVRQPVRDLIAEYGLVAE